MAASRGFSKAKPKGFKTTFHSGLEERNEAFLRSLGLSPVFQPCKIPWTDQHHLRETKDHKYTPDAELENGIVIEFKGRFSFMDQMKHRAIQWMYPDLDLRLVFSSLKGKIMSESGGTLAMTNGQWAAIHGFKAAEKIVPTEWALESPCPIRIAALEAIRIPTKH